MAQQPNKYSTGNRRGRPAHFETPDELEEAVINYFNTGTEKKTVTGLALALGFSSRASFDDYDQRNGEFSYIIKRAKLAIENSYELGGQAIDIFALKNMGWKDKVEQERYGKDGGPIENKHIVEFHDYSAEVQRDV